MADERRRIEEAIAALAAQRALLGDAVIDLAIAPLQARLAATTPTGPPPEPVDGHAQSLRHVTILFADVVGSTALSRTLDPEDIHALMDGALARLTTTVERHGGRVLQYAGDSLLAVFGYDGAHEDDAERGVRAGLALLDEMRRQGAAVKQRYGHDGFDLRAGMHTGNVLLGGGVNPDGTIRGIAVNLAARMEQTAPAGRLRISRDTFRQVRDRFDVDAQPPIEVKGMAEPVVSYLVVRERPRAFSAVATGLDHPGTEMAEAAMVGREAELARIVRVVEDACAQRASHVVTVVADAGMGKSRLLVEVERRIADDDALGRDLRVLHGRAPRHGINTPDGVLRDLMSWHCDILDSDTPDVARGKLSACFGALFGERSAEQSALVGQLIGLDYSSDPYIAGIVRDGRQIRARALHAFAQYLRLLCDRQRGVVLLLDDLHWADDGSLDLIAFLSTACADLPVVLGCFGRPALLERRPGWGDESRHATRFALGLLDADSGGRLVDALLARIATPPPELRALILESAEGNPFHIQELLGMLMDDGVIVAAADGWHVDRARLVQTKVPPTLTAVLQARLDGLPASEKQALQQESVVGSIFWDDALRVVAPRSMEALDMLMRRDLINARVESAFAGVREFEFKHHLLHQVTYDTVLKAAKRDLHKRTADWLVGVTGARVGEFLGLIADHYERAGDAASAVDYLHRAAAAAYATASFDAGLAWLERAFAQVDGGDERTRFELLTQRSQIFNSIGRRVEQAEDVAAMVALAESLDDDGLRARAARQEALVALIGGDCAQTLVAAGRAERLARAVGDDMTVAGVMLERGQAHIFLDDFDAAEAALLAALPLIEKVERRDLECVALSRLNAVVRARGEYAEARTYVEKALAIARATSNRRFEGALLNNQAILEMTLGHLERAHAGALEGLTISRAIGDHGSVAYPLGNLANIYLEWDRFDEALDAAEEGLVASRATGDIESARQMLVYVGRARAALGDVDGALAALSTAQDVKTQIDGGSMADIAKATTLVELGRLDEAGPVIARFVAHADSPSSGTPEHDSRKFLTCHRYFVATADERAGAFLVRAHAAMTKPAERLNDDDRAAYFGNLRLHREIAAAWAARADA